MKMTPDEKKARNRDNQKRWRANNPEKVRAQKRRYHERTYVHRPKPHENERDWQMFRKRLDVLLVGDSYLRENVARRMKCKPSEVPDEILEVCRPLLNLKRAMREIKADKWVDLMVEKPRQGIEVIITDGINVVAAFVREDFFECSYPSSKELGKVTHWRYLPRPPK